MIVEAKKPLRMQDRIAAIVVPCTSRKSSPPAMRARAVLLPRMQQNDLATAWLDSLKTLDTVSAAQDLYTGRGAYLGRRVARSQSADLFFVSAGLGLVDARTRVPSYGITVADRGDDAISTRVTGRFNPASWWTSIATGPFASDLSEVLDASEGLVLIALTKPYAAMLGEALDGLNPLAKSRLRIFGWHLEDVLPPSLHGSAIPYDARLNAVLPGTQTDFAQRALFHFAERVLPLANGDAATHRRLASRALRDVDAPLRVTRKRIADDDILQWIRARPAGEGVQRLLRLIRAEGIACEQARFSRLHRDVRQGAR